MLQQGNKELKQSGLFLWIRYTIQTAHLPTRDKSTLGEMTGIADILIRYSFAMFVGMILCLNNHFLSFLIHIFPYSFSLSSPSYIYKPRYILSMYYILYIIQTNKIPPSSHEKPSIKLHLYSVTKPILQ